MGSQHDLIGKASSTRRDALRSLLPSLTVVAQTIPNGAAIDTEVGNIMNRTHAKGMAVAVIDHGAAGYVQAYQPDGTSGRVGGSAPDHASYRSYATLERPGR